VLAVARGRGTGMLTAAFCIAAVAVAVAAALCFKSACTKGKRQMEGGGKDSTQRNACTQRERFGRCGATRATVEGGNFQGSATRGTRTGGGGIENPKFFICDRGVLDRSGYLIPCK